MFEVEKRPFGHGSVSTKIIFKVKTNLFNKINVEVKLYFPKREFFTMQHKVLSYSKHNYKPVL